MALVDWNAVDLVVLFKLANTFHICGRDGGKDLPTYCIRLTKQDRAEILDALRRTRADSSSSP